MKMQQHVRKQHNLEYGEYCLTRRDPTVSQVMHQCKICSDQFAIIEKDAFDHLKKHGIDGIDRIDYGPHNLKKNRRLAH